MATTLVPNGTTATGDEVTNGNTLEVQSGGTATNTQVDSGGTLLVDAGGTDNTATILAGGVETDNGTSTGDTVAGTINVGQSGTSTPGVVNNVTIQSGGSVNLTIKGTLVSGATVNTNGSLTINGNAAANGVTLQGGLLDLQSAKADSTNSTGASASGSLTFASGFSSRLQLDAAQTGANGTTFAQTIAGYANGDIIELKALTAAGAVVAPTVSNGNTTIKVTGGNGSGTETFTFANNVGTFSTQSDANGGLDLVEAPVCFVSGTRIRIASPQGGTRDVAIEQLAVGDLAVTASGEHCPIRWLGHRAVNCRHHPRPHEALPVRIAAHAFGHDRPTRDLWVSPGHAICVDLLGEVLIPAAALINGTTVTQENADRVTYWHVELDRHEVVLAENLPCESYLEMGNRGFFAEAEVTNLSAGPDAPVATHAEFCRPFHGAGALVHVTRARLAAQAASLGWRLEPTPLKSIHLIVDGVRIDAGIRGSELCFAMPAGATEVWLVSPAAVASEIDAGNSDCRKLGVAIARLVVVDGFLDPRVIKAADARLCAGFHDAEGDTHRWTVGRAHLPADLWNGCSHSFFLRVELFRPPLSAWVSPGDAIEAPATLTA